MAKGIKTGGRKNGTPNKKTQALIELMGDYSPVTNLLNIVQGKNTPLDIKVKINLDLMSYIYPKRKAIEIKDDTDKKARIEEVHKQLEQALFNAKQ